MLIIYNFFYSFFVEIDFNLKWQHSDSTAICISPKVMLKVDNNNNNNEDYLYSAQSLKRLYKISNSNITSQK